MMRSAKTLGRAGHGLHHRLDLGSDPLQLGQVRPGDLDADGVLMPVASMSMRVLMGIVQALFRPGNLDGGVHRVDQFVRRAAAVRDDFARRRP